jgi:hypothetical protein
MSELTRCEFFLLRYVPDAVKDEFVNIGVVLVEAGGFAGVRFTRDWLRVRCLDPAADIETLEALEAEIRQRLADGQDRERLLHLLQDSFSNMVQLSPSKACLAESAEAEIGKLAEMYLGTRRRAPAQDRAGRGVILGRMREAFEQAGVWDLLHRRIAAAKYTHKGDPLRIDFGYRPNGVIKMFHAVSLASGVDAAKLLAFSFPQVREGIALIEHAKAELTAVVEDDLNRGEEMIAFALETLAKSDIAVAPVSEMPGLAEIARRDLRV